MLARVQAAGEIEDERYKQRVHEREAELGAKLYGRKRAELGAAAPLSIDPEVGQMLYALALAAWPTVIVEFGASLGVSTIYLASALRDLGAGSIITTELLPHKARRIAEHLADAGLDDLVEVRIGDALATLTDIDVTVDMLFLDGANDLYLPVLELLEPRLSDHALIVADMSADEPEHTRYRQHVTRRYATTEIPLDAGVVVSTPSSLRDPKQAPG